MEKHMEKAKKIFLSSILLLLSGCSYFEQPLYEPLAPFPVEPEPTIEVINSAEMTSVIQNYTVMLKHKKRLRLEHANTFYKDGIRTVQLRFDSQDLKDMCEARMLIVDVVEGLLADLNENPLLGVEFSNFPMRPSNLEIYIRFESYYGRYVDPYYISCINLEDGVVIYYTFDLHDRNKSCWHKRVEDYSTSREIALYQRAAEKAWDDEHNILNTVFGNKRYFPPDER